MSCDNSEIFAYQRTYKNKSIVVIINRNLVKSNEINIKIKNYKQKSKINFAKESTNLNIVKSRVLGKLKPAEIIVFTVE